MSQKSRENIQKGNDSFISYGLRSTILSHTLVWTARFWHAWRLKSSPGYGLNLDPTTSTSQDIQSYTNVLNSSVVGLAWTRPRIWMYLCMTILSGGLYLYICRIAQRSKAARSASAKQDISSDAGGIFDLAWDLIFLSHSCMVIGALGQLFFGWSSNQFGSGWPGTLWVLGVFGLSTYKLYTTVRGVFGSLSGMATGKSNPTQEDGNRQGKRTKRGKNM